MWTNSLPLELLNTVHCMDCLEFMKTLPDGCIDLTVTSPPYDNLRSYNNDIHNTRWETVWKPILKELYRITKEWWVLVRVVWDATINWSETGTSFKQALYAKEDCWFNIHDTMVYAKDNPVPQNHNRYEQQREYMFVFSKWKPTTVNKILENCKYKWWNSMWTYYKSDWTISDAQKKWQPIKETKPKTNIRYYFVWWIWLWHPAIFPEELARDHILSRSNEWDVVFDPFMWSWTTAKMAKQYWRNYLWCELSIEYIEIINNRLSNTTVSLFHS